MQYRMPNDDVIARWQVNKYKIVDHNLLTWGVFKFSNDCDLSFCIDGTTYKALCRLGKAANTILRFSFLPNFLSIICCETLMIYEVLVDIYPSDWYG